MNDFFFMLTATLKLAPGPGSSSSSSSSVKTNSDPKELTNSSNDDSDRTIVDNGFSQTPPREPSISNKDFILKKSNKNAFFWSPSITIMDVNWRNNGIAIAQDESSVSTIWGTQKVCKQTLSCFE